MTKDELLVALETGRETFLDALDGLSDEQMTAPGVNGEWSLKDLLAHLTRWEAELVKLLWEVEAGLRPTTAHVGKLSVDEVNAQFYAEMRWRSLRRVLDDFHAVRNQTILRVEALSDQELTDPRRYAWLKGRALWEVAAGDSFEHEAEHLDQVRLWREGLIP
jgi:hypothetical protein